LTRKKLKIWDFKISKRLTFTTELQSEQVQTHPQKFALTLALKWYPQDIIGRAKPLLDIPAANQNQGGKCIFSLGISPFGPQNDTFYRGQFVIWPRVLIIMEL